jgi:hypothetical protein
MLLRAFIPLTTLIAGAPFSAQDRSESPFVRSLAGKAWVFERTHSWPLKERTRKRKMNAATAAALRIFRHMEIQRSLNFQHKIIKKCNISTAHILTENIVRVILKFFFEHMYL